METKGILRMVLRIVFLVILGVMTSGSSCGDKDKGGGNPVAEGEPVLSVPDILVISYIDTDGVGGTFGTVIPGDSTNRLVQIRNKGTATLKYYPPEVTPTSAFSAFPHPTSPKPCSFLNGYESELQPGETCDFLVEFRCALHKQGTVNGSMVIKSNDPDEPTVNISFSGVCEDVVAPAPPAPPPPAPRSRSGRLR